MDENLDLRVDGRYRLLRKLGSGSFGVVYEAIDLETNQKVGIKLEHFTILDSLLGWEIEAYQALSGRPGVARVYANGEDGEYLYLVLELLGPSLKDLLSYCGGKFSMKTVLMLADQLIRRLEHLHLKDLVHRDVGPHNFLMGLGRYGNVVYMIDFGMCAYSQPPPSNLHSRKTTTIGTHSFASVSGHLLFGRCRCDDLESLGYVFLHFIRGTLPWDNVKGESETQTARMLLEQKKSISIEDLCAGLPKAFADYFNHIRSHQNDDKPNYSYLRKIFQRQFFREGFKHDNVYDWTIRKFLQMTTMTTTTNTITIPSPPHSSPTPAKQLSSEEEDSYEKEGKSPRLKSKKQARERRTKSRSKSKKQARERRTKSRAKKQASTITKSK